MKTRFALSFAASLAYIHELGVANIQAHRQPLLTKLRDEMPRLGYPVLTPAGTVKVSYSEPWWRWLLVGLQIVVVLLAACVAVGATRPKRSQNAVAVASRSTDAGASSE